VSPATGSYPSSLAGSGTSLQQPFVVGTSALGGTGYAASGGTIPGATSGLSYPPGATTDFGPATYGGPTAVGSPAVGYPPSATLGQSGLTSPGYSSTSGTVGLPPTGNLGATSGDVPPLFGSKLAGVTPGTAGYGAGLNEPRERVTGYGPGFNDSKERVVTATGTEAPVSFHATEAQRERAILKDPHESLGTKVVLH